MLLNRVAAVVAVACLPLSVHAAPVVDQSNSSVSIGGFCYIDAVNLCGQSFVQANGNISGAGFQINRDYAAGPGTVTISIYSGYSATPTGLIASGTSGLVDSNSGWVDVFWSPAALTAGHQYYMVIQASTTGLVAGFTIPTASYAAGSTLYQGYSYASYDLAFRTYYDSVGSQVPEPLSLSLVGLGLLAGLGLGRRKAA